MGEQQLLGAQSHVRFAFNGDAADDAVKVVERDEDVADKRVAHVRLTGRNGVKRLRERILSSGALVLHAHIVRLRGTTRGANIPRGKPADTQRLECNTTRKDRCPTQTDTNTELAHNRHRPVAHTYMT